MIIAAWFESFHSVMHELQKDILKSKIQKAFGPKMEKAADLIIETVREKMKSGGEGHEGALREKLRQLMQEG